MNAKLIRIATLRSQILFYDDPATLEAMAEKRPLLKDHLPQCELFWPLANYSSREGDMLTIVVGMEHANGMLQYAGKFPPRVSVFSSEYFLTVRPLQFGLCSRQRASDVICNITARW